ncbi:MAG: ester cyclase, partial [Anaerolineales bacterium]
LRAFPDLRVTLDDLVVEGGRIALAWTWHGTHRGVVMNIPPTDRPVTVRGMSFLTVEEGQIRRGVRLWDVAGLLRALGLLLAIAALQQTRKDPAGLSLDSA